ncbi:MAG: hypothetical protein HKN07_11715 [Acidimicrobiia bacterium]|nr:hypothetical protein [Acidimicrobiia bacterium]NNF64907.1 hypothetical protein [Acidimicrobiia bacterium]
MTDENSGFSELLKTPLEKPKRPGDRSRREQAPSLPVAAVIGGLVIGAGIVLAGFTVARSSEEPVTAPTVATSIQQTTTTTAAPTTVAPTSGLPTGFVALNDRVGVRPVRILHRGSEVFVSFVTAVLTGLDPEETSGFNGGKWQLLLDDETTVENDQEFFDALARGSFTVKFTVPDGVSPTGVRLAGEALRNSTAFQSEVSVEGLPATLPREEFAVDGDVTLVIDEMEIREDGGLINWQLEGNSDVTASVQPMIISHNSNQSFPTVLPVRSFSSTFDFFSPIFDVPPTSRSDTLELEPPPLADVSVVERLEIEWFVSWVVYLPANVEIPLEDVPLARVEL